MTNFIENMKSIYKNFKCFKWKPNDILNIYQKIVMLKSNINGNVFRSIKMI